MLTARQFTVRRAFFGSVRRAVLLLLAIALLAPPAEATVTAMGSAGSLAPGKAAFWSGPMVTRGGGCWRACGSASAGA